MICFTQHKLPRCYTAHGGCQLSNPAVFLSHIVSHLRPSLPLSLLPLRFLPPLLLATVRVMSLEQATKDKDALHLEFLHLWSDLLPAISAAGLLPPPPGFAPPGGYPDLSQGCCMPCREVPEDTVRGMVGHAVHAVAVFCAHVVRGAVPKWAAGGAVPRRLKALRQEAPGAVRPDSEAFREGAQKLMTCVAWPWPQPWGALTQDQLLGAALKQSEYEVPRQRPQDMDQKLADAGMGLLYGLVADVATAPAIAVAWGGAVLPALHSILDFTASNAEPPAQLLGAFNRLVRAEAQQRAQAEADAPGSTAALPHPDPSSPLLQASRWGRLPEVPVVDQPGYKGLETAEERAAYEALPSSTLRQAYAKLPTSALRAAFAALPPDAAAKCAALPLQEQLVCLEGDGAQAADMLSLSPGRKRAVRVLPAALRPSFLQLDTELQSQAAQMPPHHLVRCMDAGDLEERAQLIRMEHAQREVYWELPPTHQPLFMALPPKGKQLASKLEKVQLVQWLQLPPLDQKQYLQLRSQKWRLTYGSLHAPSRPVFVGLNEADRTSLCEIGDLQAQHKVLQLPSKEEAHALLSLPSPDHIKAHLQLPAQLRQRWMALEGPDLQRFLALPLPSQLAWAREEVQQERDCALALPDLSITRAYLNLPPHQRPRFLGLQRGVQAGLGGLDAEGLAANMARFDHNEAEDGEALQGVLMPAEVRAGLWVGLSHLSGWVGCVRVQPLEHLLRHA